MAIEPNNQPVIIRLTAETLRKIADQLDAYTALARAGADHLSANTVINVDGQPLAYLAWWHDENQHMAEFTNFVPGPAKPLIWHKEYREEAG